MRFNSHHRTKDMEAWKEKVNLIQQLRIRTLREELVGVLMTIHKIGNFQMYPTILLTQTENFVGPEVQGQRSDMKKFLSEIPNEKSGLPHPKGGEGTAETSFTGLDYGEAEILLKNQKLMRDYPEYGKSGNILNLEYIEDDKGKGKVYVIGPQGGRYPLFKADGETLNPKLPNEVPKTLRPKTTEVIQQNKEKIETINKDKKENQQIADDENEEPAVRERAREKVRESNEEISQLENTNERLREKLPLRERIKALFKKYGFTVTTVLAAIGRYCW